ncbi:MAG: AraC family transcriptional regulator [Planctomycetes bacterium]|nr:AraC family transcriptional regulator [Planctomycetota bacterium]
MTADQPHLNVLLSRPIGPADGFPYVVRYQNVAVVEPAASLSIGPHQHPHYEIILVERGPYRCRVNDARIDLPGSGLVVLKPGDWHDDGGEPPLRYHALSFRIIPGPSAERSANIFIDESAPASQVIVGDVTPFLGLFGRLQDENRRADAFSAFMLDALVLELLWTLLRVLPAPIIHPALMVTIARHGFAAELMRLFSRHLATTLDLGQMAAAMSMSKRSLTTRCAETFQTSPAKLLVRYKMERAKTLLRQTDLSIKQISARLGFENPFHFSKVYKRHFGRAPAIGR